jgi:hypothetical protein
MPSTILLAKAQIQRCIVINPFCYRSKWVHPRGVGGKGAGKALLPGRGQAELR